MKLGPGTETFRWTIWRGMSWRQRVQIVDDDGNPRDLTDASARLLLGRSWQDEPVLEATIGAGIEIDDAGQGWLIIDLGPIPTRALELGPAVIDLSVTDAAGTKLLHVRALGQVRETLDALLGDEVIQVGPDGFAGLVGDRPAVSGAVSETEALLTRDPARTPAANVVGLRPLKPLLDAKADLTAVTAALAEKADQSAVDAALAGKADQSALDSGLATKADAAATTNVLATKAPLSSPEFTGEPKGPTPATSDNSTRLATTAMVRAALAELVASSPAALDTLNELSAALGNDENFATTMTAALAGKLSSQLAGGWIEGARTRPVTERFAERLSVGDFAVGSGAVNDRDGVQAVEDLAYARYLATGKPVELWFPQGDFAISSSLVKRPGVHWRGAGRIRRRDNAAPSANVLWALVVADNVDDWSIEGLSFEAIDMSVRSGMSSPTSSTLIGEHNTCVDARECENWSIKGCRFYKFQHGIIYQQSKNFAIEVNWFFAQSGKTQASLLDGTYTSYAGGIRTNSAAITTRYNATSPTPPAEYGRICGNFIPDGVGLDAGIIANLYSYGPSPLIVEGNIIVGPHCGVQCYNAAQLGEPAFTGDAFNRVQLRGNFIYATWEQGIYSRGQISGMIRDNWLERCGLVGDNGDASCGSIVLRINPFDELAYATQGLTDFLGDQVTGNVILNHSRDGTPCNGAAIIEHNRVTFKNNVIVRDPGLYSDPRGPAIYVDNGKDIYHLWCNENIIYGFTTGVSHSGASSVHRYMDGSIHYEGNRIFFCAEAIRITSRKAVRHFIRRNFIYGSATKGLYLKQSPFAIVEENDFVRCAIGFSLASGTLSSTVANLCSGAGIAEGNRAGSTVCLDRNRFDACAVPYQVEETGTDDALITDRLLSMRGNRVNGRLIQGQEFANSAPDIGTVKTWSVGEEVFNPVPGAGLIRRICSQAGTFEGVALTTTCDTTSGSAVLTNFASLAGWGPGMYVALSGVTGNKLVTDIAIYNDRFVAEGVQTEFQLSATPANLAATVVIRDGAVVSSGVSLNADLLTFSVAPPNSSTIRVIHLALCTLTVDSLCDATVAGSTISRSPPAFVSDQYEVPGALTDAAASLTWGTAARRQVLDVPLTAARSITLGTSTVEPGARYRIVRTANATGAFNLNVGTGPLKALTAAGQWCDVYYDGIAWKLEAAGSF